MAQKVGGNRCGFVVEGINRQTERPSPTNHNGSVAGSLRQTATERHLGVELLANGSVARQIRANRQTPVVEDERPSRV